MKKFYTLILSLLAFCAASAQLSGDGYYRVYNNVTNRYIHVTDNKGHLNWSTTSADYYAIVLKKDFERAISDPASVLYVKEVGGKYDLQAQGTGLYSMIEAYVSLRHISSSNTYLAYVSNGLMTKYLSDGSNDPYVESYLSDTHTGERRNWKFSKVSRDDASCFGVKPTFTADGRRFAPFYASFPFTPVSDAMRVWYVVKVDTDRGVAVVKEIKGTVPASTPVIIECPGESPVGNKLDLGGTATVLSDNILSGTYFNNSMKTHLNQVPYDSQTMMVPGATADGKIGFVKSSTLDFIPANTSYLHVSAGNLPQELKFMEADEYFAGVDIIGADSGFTGPFDVYNILGVRVRKGVTSVDGLPAGIYIVNGRKLVVR